MALGKYIPGQEYEFATVEKIKDRIEHLNWLLAPGHYQGAGQGDLAVERDMLKYQWLGNAEIRQRKSEGGFATVGAMAAIVTLGAVAWFGRGLLGRRGRS